MLTHVSIKNYKSLADVDVELGPLTVLVGQNSTGKSNFIDALHFLSDAVALSLDEAVIRRGGIDAIRCATCQPLHDSISFELYFQFAEESGKYGLELLGNDAEYRVQHEKVVLSGVGYEAKDGQFRWVGDDTKQPLPWGDHQRLLLSLLSTSSTDNFQILKFLSHAGYYSVFPNSSLRKPQKPIKPQPLREDGLNLNSTLWLLRNNYSAVFQELSQIFTRMVPGVHGIDVDLIGGFLVVKLQYQYNDKVESFDLSQESDGTLRLLGILTALYQTPTPTLIAIEEPELTVHPGALKMLYEAIEEASQRTQIIITTHSPDLISYCNPENIRLVEKVDGMTRISPLEQRQIDIVNDQLFSTGDLLRIEGLRPQRQG